ncbi:hypothetical protein RUND412_010096 [Rhizina undulata]
MNEENFGPKNGLRESVKTFDAFPKTHITYTTRSSRGGFVTVLLLTICAYLTLTELSSHLSGTSSHTFLIEKSIGHEMQINLDITVAMPCDSLHVNVQDASGDRILAGEILKKDAAMFDDRRAHKLRDTKEAAEEHVHDVISRGKKKSKFGKTGRKGQACRIYGSMDVNRVQGDFHITARGHGYWDGGKHVDHESFNFSHVVNELSFGEFYPKLVNPLDGVVATSEEHFHKFQYYLSVVPTLYQSYTTGRSLLTNQYAVTEQSREVSPHAVPGIFFKFDIEPISLTITEYRTPLIQFIIRLANIIGGVLVGGGWVYKFTGLFAGLFKKPKKNMEGMLNGKTERED